MADTLRADQLIEGNELLANISLVRDLLGMDFSTGVGFTVGSGTLD